MNREKAAKKKKQAAAKKNTGKAKRVPKKVVSRTDLAETVPSTPSPLPVVPPVFTETPSPTQGRGDATVAGHLRSSHEDQLTALEEGLIAQWDSDIGDLRAGNLMLLRTRVEMASRLDEMRDRLDALTARVREQDSRRARAPPYPTERDRYRSRSRSCSPHPQYWEREHRYRR